LRKVLFITYHFPPSGGSKTRRTLKFLKYLPYYAWTPVVLTAKEGKIFNFDSSLLGEISQDIQLYRSRGLAWFTKDTSSLSKPKEKKNPYNVKSIRKLFKLLRNKTFQFLKSWIAIPDEFIIWAPHAILKGIHIVNKEKVEVIYSTAPPFSNHLVAVFLKKLTRKPLVTDFRDAWIANPARNWKYPRLRCAIEFWLENVVIKHSNVVIATTDGMVQDFRTRYPFAVATKFVTLPNGYDLEDQKVVGQYRDIGPRKMRIVYTGYLKTERSPKPFLQALRLLLDERPQLEEKIEVYFVGETNEFLDGKTTSDYLEQYSLRSVVTLTGHIPRIDALNYQESSDILLLIIGIVPKDEVFTYGIASKIFDYMIANKPVLAIAEEGPVSELVDRTKIGVVFDPSDVLGIKHYLSESFDMYKVNKLDINPDLTEVAKYDVKNLTEKLTDLLDMCTQGKR
jgi:glycosyltransferase involved in cell wall biosynthesis